jgi:alkylated DNA repair dioxygenase AlkB
VRLSILRLFGECDPVIDLRTNWVSETEETDLLNSIDNETWDSTLKRRVQHYGYSYNYKTRTVIPASPFPPWLSNVCERLVNQNIMLYPDQCIVNEYRPGQGIAAHVDADVFGPVIVSLSLLSDAVMVFGGGVDLRLGLVRRSLLVLSGPSRTEFSHRINGSGVASRRVSITLRTVREKS